MILSKESAFKLDFAADGQEAMDKIKADLYDLVLLDLNMPKLDGYEVLKQVRSLYPALPVIFITATGEVKKIMQCIAQDKLTAFIEKPFTAQNVLEDVKRALNIK